jgi:hypothetical protein
VHAALDTLVVALYVTIDELLGRRRGPGRRPKLTDAELVCLAVAQVLLGFGSERRGLRFASRRLGHPFPYLPTHRPTTAGCASPPTRQAGATSYAWSERAGRQATSSTGVQVDAGRDGDAAADRAGDRAAVAVEAEDPLDRGPLRLLRGQPVADMDAPDDQDLAIQLDLADRVCLETTVSGRDAARLQRASVRRVPPAVRPTAPGGWRSGAVVRCWWPISLPWHRIGRRTQEA